MPGSKISYVSLPLTLARYMATSACPTSASAEMSRDAVTATPTEAIKAGADFLVVGRPILAAPDPRAAAQAIVDEIAAAK